MLGLGTQTANVSKLFLSYRRSDTQMVAGRLREWLVVHFGKDAVFRDKDSIGAGEDWADAIRDRLSGDVIVLALIGHDWVKATDAHGRRRLDDPGDWNRRELELALAQGLRLVPVLVDGATMPAESELPSSLQPVARFNAIRLRDDDWESDVQRLSLSLKLQPKFRQRHWLGALTVVLLVVIATGIWWSQTQNVDESATLVDGSRRRITSRDEAVRILSSDQYTAIAQLKTDPARAAQIFSDNFVAVDAWLAKHPRDVELLSLAGYAAKNIYANTEGQLLPSVRAEYLVRAERMFQQALDLSAQDAGALNGMGNVRFYQGRLDAAIALHTQALELRPDYAAAKHDLELVRKSKTDLQLQTRGAGASQLPK